MAFPSNCVAIGAPGGDPMVSIGAGMSPDIGVTFTECSGEPIDPANYSRAVMVVREYKGDNRLLFKSEGTFLEDGQVMFPIPPKCRPGIWSASFVLYDNNDKPVVDQPAWFELKPTAAFRMSGNIPPVGISDIRELLWDRYPDDNFLLDSVEFSDHQVASAAQWVVDKWNETPPSVGSYTVVSFPWRHHHALGAASRLLRTAAINQARNTLQYQAGGVGVKDKGKHPEYMELSNTLEREFLEWMDRKKVEINVNLCYGTLSSGVF